MIEHSLSTYTQKGGGRSHQKRTPNIQISISPIFPLYKSNRGGGGGGSEKRQFVPYFLATISFRFQCVSDSLSRLNIKALLSHA